MANDTFTLEVVTPARQVVRETVTEAQIPVLGGYVGVLPGHTPLLAEMGDGELTYRVGTREFSCASFGGFVEVLADRVIVLADDAERAEEINVSAAQVERDKNLILSVTGNDPTVDWKLAQQNLERAKIRLQVAAKAGALAPENH